MRTAMLFFAISIAWPRLVPFTGHLGSDAVDAIKGALLGVGLGLIVLGARLGGFRRPGLK